MNHPEIPPNCEYFDKQDGYPATFDWPDTFHWEIGDPHSSRPIITCIAAEYWLIEGKAQTHGPQKEEMESRGLGLPEREACYDNYEYSCELKAEQWRKWGRGEPWK